MSITIQLLNIEQSRKLLKAAKGHPQETLFMLTLATGMRRSELLGLQWHDIDFELKVLHIRRSVHNLSLPQSDAQSHLSTGTGLKTKRSERSLALTEWVLDALHLHQARQKEMRCKADQIWKDLDYVFCRSDGAPLNAARDVQVPLHLFLQQAGLPNVSFHSLRLSTATFLITIGVHPHVIPSLLGMVERIRPLTVLTPISAAMQREAMEKLSNLFAYGDLIDEQKEDKWF